MVVVVIQFDFYIPEEKTLPDESKTDADQPNRLPHFPMVPDSMLSQDQMEERARRLEKWLRYMLSVPINREYHETVIIGSEVDSYPSIVVILGRILGHISLLLHQRTWR